MTDLMLQTLIFSSILLIILFIAMRYIKQVQNPTQNDAVSVLEESNAELSKCNRQLSENVASLKQDLAVSQSNMTHLDGVQEALAKQQKDNAEYLNVIANLKAEVSKFTTQVEEKGAQLQRFTAELKDNKTEFVKLSQQNQSLSNENAEQSEKLKHLAELKADFQSSKTELSEKASELSELKSQLSADVEAKKSLQEKIALLESAEKRLVTQFENAANKIFKEKTGEFSQQNKSSLDAVLAPLKQQIGSFSKQVNDVYTNEAKERHALKEEVGGLRALNEQMSKEATALTRALKGDNKKQGTWGEVVLEKVLEASGLRKNHEYETQVSLKNDEGKLLKPDVIVHLPGGKDVVVDSKMALTAYERYFNADDELVQKTALKEHAKSIKTHILGLSEKKYHDLYGIKSLDYVLMFIPLEPAFNAAVEYDPEIIDLALDKNIMLVSPTNLMVALKTINNMWRVENQNLNAQEIAKKAGAIYDKLVGFVGDMQKLGTHMQKAEDSYGDAMKKLSEGRGNLIRSAEKMKELRIDNNKSLPTTLVERAVTETLTETH